MSNSPLVCYTRLSPNCTKPRNHAIDTITIHCMAGNCSIETCGEIFAPSSRQASSNYGIGGDGRIALYVDEANRSWCTSSSSNDNRAVTIEVANTIAADPWPVSDAAYAALLDLVTDICRRNGIEKLLWQGNKSLIGQVEKQNMTVHRWFAAKACPGDYLYNRHGAIAEEVNKRLNAAADNTDNETEEDDDMVRYERLSDIPDTWGGGEPRATIEKLMDAGILNGDGSDPDGNNDVIDLSHDMMRTIILLYRGGGFDKQLLTAGMEPAVSG